MAVFEKFGLLFIPASGHFEMSKYNVGNQNADEAKDRQNEWFYFIKTNDKKSS